MPYTVGEVARLSGVSVRTLHHYEAEQVLKPSGRTDAGYRLYDDGDLDLLQQILTYKELGFSLEEIARILSDPGFDRVDALVAQRELIAEKIKRSEALLSLLDRTIAAAEGGIRMTKEEMFEVFGDFDPSEYEEEVQERWGETEAYKESKRRASKYTKADWERFKAESLSINDEIVRLMEEGVDPTDPRAMDAVDRHRRQIDEWFYPCSKEMHVNLGRMYVADPRFTATYEKIHTGMAQYVCDAIEANAKRDQG